jgi:hypothetical protein
MSTILVGYTTGHAIHADSETWMGGSIIVFVCQHSTQVVVCSPASRRVVKIEHGPGPRYDLPGWFLSSVSCTAAHTGVCCMLVLQHSDELAST